MNLFDKVSLQTTYSFEKDGLIIKANISPCSKMYPDYGLKVCFLLPMQDNTENVCKSFSLNKSILFKDATNQDVHDLFNNIVIDKCINRCCSNKTITSEKNNRNGLCETCFLDNFYQNYYTKEIQEIEKELTYILEKQKNGYLYISKIYIHPDIGDDFVVDYFSNQYPTKKELNDFANNYQPAQYEVSIHSTESYLSNLNLQKDKIQLKKEKMNISLF